MPSVKKNFAYSVAYQVLTLILPLATSPYLSRVLGADGIGTYSYTYSIAYYFVMFAMLGVNNYGNRCVARVRDNRTELSKAFWSVWALQAVLTVATTAFYIAYTFVWAGNPVIALIWGFYVVSAAFDVNWLFFGLEEFRITVGRNFAVKIITFACVFLFVKGEHALESYCILLSVSYLISVAVLWPFVKRRVDLYKPSLWEIFSHLKPNLVLFVPVIAISLYTVLDKVMLGQMSSMEQAGYFENALKVAGMPFALISALGTVMLPHSSHRMISGDYEGVRRSMGASIWLALALSAAFAFGLAGIAEVFVPVFFGEGYEACTLLVCLLVVKMPFMAWANVLRTQWLIPAGRDRFYLLSVFVGAVVNIALNLVFIPRLGAMGAALSLVAAEVAVCLVQTWSVSNELPQARWLKRCVPFYLIGFAMFFAVHAFGSVMGVSITTLIAQIVLGGFIFVLLSFLWCRVSNDPYYMQVIQPMLRKALGYFRR